MGTENIEDEILALVEAHNDEDNDITTQTWARLRAAILERDKYTCQICHGEANTVHHQRYGIIRPQDLTSLCVQCHLKCHHIKVGRSRPLTKKEIREAEINRLKKIIQRHKNYIQAVEDHILLPFAPPGVFWRDIYEEAIKEAELKIAELEKRGRRHGH